METLKVLAPAKVNLFLGIGARREDGYHDAHSILHALSLHDTLSFSTPPVELCDVELVEEGGLSVGVETLWREGMEPIDIPAADNLVTKAALALARAFDYPWRGCLRISVEKHIPAQAGLGGGSSDAAATLVGCAELWGISPQDGRLAEVARGLGADVAFFLQGGCGAYGGRGDVLERTLTPRKDAVLLVVAPGGVSTTAAYRAFDAQPVEIPAELRGRAEGAVEAQAVPLFNNLAPAAESLLPELADVRAWAQAADGITDVLLSGSGAATFCVCANSQVALDMAVQARSRGWVARATSFSSLRAAALPGKKGTNLGAARILA